MRSTRELPQPAAVVLEFERAGRYVFFVQVRVDGFVHSVPVSTVVS